MTFATRCRAAVALTILAGAGSACGGDSTGPGGPPQPPAGSATQVPRVLGLSTIDGKRVPVMHYTSPTYQSDAWTDSGSATLQDDSMLVLRTYTRWVDHGAGSQAPGTADMFTTAGRLRSTGIAILPYSDGSADTAHVLANGAIEAQLSINENGTTKPYGTFLFSAPYSGSSLNPIPYVRSIQPASLPELADSAVVTLTGTSFLPTTQLWWDKQTPLKVTFVGPYELTTVLHSTNLLTAGQHTLTVRNPGPGGGDRIFAYDVTVPEPMIISISPATMVAAGGDFVLHVNGKNFVQGTRVLWNGTPHAATVLSSTDLWTNILSSDIPAAGTYQVAVQTPAPTAPLTGGGTSGVIFFSVTGTPAQLYSTATAHANASLVVADPTRSLVYALADHFEISHPNSVMAIDPTTGQTAWVLDLGSVPRTAAISDDGAYLYVAAAVDSVIRIALATHTVDAIIPLTTATSGHSAGLALAVVPGQPHTIAVARGCGCAGSGSASWTLEIYDDAQRRAQAYMGVAEPSAIGFASAQSLYSTEQGSLTSYSVTSGGVALQAHNVALLGFGTFTFAGRGVYSTYGGAYDLTTHTSMRLSMLPGYGVASVAPSSDGQLLYTVGDGTSYVRAFDIASDAEVGAVQFTTAATLPDYGYSMVRWGKDGLAFVTGGVIYFLRASFVK